MDLEPCRNPVVQFEVSPENRLIWNFHKFADNTRASRRSGFSREFDLCDRKRGNRG
jgi:hypothetical protein